MKKKGNGAGRKKPSPKSQAFLAVVTCIDLLLSLLLAVFHRLEVIHAVQNDEDVQVLLRTQKETKEP